MCVKLTIIPGLPRRKRSSERTESWLSSGTQTTSRIQRKRRKLRRSSSTSPRPKRFWQTQVGSEPVQVFKFCLRTNWCVCFFCPEKRTKFDHGEDPLDPESQQHHNFHGGFQGFQGFNPFGSGPFSFKFGFNWGSISFFFFSCTWLKRGRWTTKRAWGRSVPVYSPQLKMLLGWRTRQLYGAFEGLFLCQQMTVMWHFRFSLWPCHLYHLTVRPSSHPLKLQFVQKYSTIFIWVFFFSEM